MSLRLMLVTLLLVIAASCGDDVSGPVNPGSDPDEYAVYSALIDSLYIVNDVALVVIRIETENYPLWDTNTVRHIREKLTVPDALIDAYMRRNAVSVPLQRKFTIETDYVLLADTAAQRIWAGGGWEEFYRLYPKSQGYMTLSRVGFSADGNTALVYASNTPMFLAGHGICATLEKTGGRWKVTGEVIVWIS